MCLAAPAAGSWLSLANHWFSSDDGPARPSLGVMALVLAIVPFAAAAIVWMLRHRRSATTSATIRTAGTVAFVLALISVVASAIVSLQT